jgi:hypothetical protein
LPNKTLKGNKKDEYGLQLNFRRKMMEDFSMLEVFESNKKYPMAPIG